MKGALLVYLLFILLCVDLHTAVVVKAAWVVESFDNFGGSGPQQPLHINLAERLVSFEHDKCRITIKTKISSSSNQYGLSVSAREGRGVITVKRPGNIMNKAIDRATFSLTDANSERVFVLYDWSNLSWAEEDKLRTTLTSMLVDYNAQKVSLWRLVEQVFDVFRRQTGGMHGCVLVYGVTDLAVSSMPTDPYYYKTVGDGLVVDYAAVQLHPNYVVHDQKGPEWIYISESIVQGGRSKKLASFSSKGCSDATLVTMKRVRNGRLSSFGPRSITDHEIGNVRVEGDASMATIVLNAQHLCIFTLFWVESDQDMSKWRHIQVEDLYDFTKDLTCDSDSSALMTAMRQVSHFLLPQTPALLVRHSLIPPSRLSPVSNADDNNTLIASVPESALEKIPIYPDDASEATLETADPDLLTLHNSEILMPPPDDPDVTESLEEPLKLNLINRVPPPPPSFSFDHHHQQPLASEASESVWMNFVNPTVFD